MSARFVPDVKALGVNPQQPFHAAHQIRRWRLQDQVKMIAHQTVGVNLPPRLAARLPQRRQKPPPVSRIPKDALPLVPAIHHMINRARIFHPQRSGHGSILPSINISVNSED